MSAPATHAPLAFGACPAGHEVDPPPLPHAATDAGPANPAAASHTVARFVRFAGFGWRPRQESNLRPTL